MSFFYLSLELSCLSAATFLSLSFFEIHIFIFSLFVFIYRPGTGLNKRESVPKNLREEFSLIKRCPIWLKFCVQLEAPEV